MILAVCAGIMFRLHSRWCLIELFGSDKQQTRNSDPALFSRSGCSEDVPKPPREQLADVSPPPDPILPRRRNEKRVHMNPVLGVSQPA